MIAFCTFCTVSGGTAGLPGSSSSATLPVRWNLLTRFFIASLVGPGFLNLQAYCYITCKKIKTVSVSSKCIVTFESSCIMTSVQKKYNLKSLSRKKISTLRGNLIAKNTVIQILRAASDGCRSWPWLAYSRVSGPSDCRCFQTLTVLFQFIFWVDGHAHRRTFAKWKH